jgi:hypothetical protein
VDGHPNQILVSSKRVDLVVRDEAKTWSEARALHFVGFARE